MATDTYSGGGSTFYARPKGHAEERPAVSGYHDPAGTAFLWVGWTIAFVFWVFAMSTFVGILQAIGRGGPGTMRGGVEIFSGGQVLTAVIAAVVVLGAAIGWAFARSTARDRGRDAVTEAATAELYDSAVGVDEDAVGRSQAARRPVDRDGYR